MYVALALCSRKNEKACVVQLTYYTCDKTKYVVCTLYKQLLVFAVRALFSPLLLNNVAQKWT